MEDLIEVVMKDGNRAVNWEFSRDTPIMDVWHKWTKDYYQPESILLHGTEIPPLMGGCFLSAFTDDRRMLMIVRTKFPKKRKEDNG